LLVVDRKPEVKETRQEGRKEGRKTTKEEKN
jgi:hypothetical protein